MQKELEAVLRQYGSVIIHTSDGQFPAQISRELFRDQPEQASELVELIYQAVTRNHNYIKTIEPATEL